MCLCKRASVRVQYVCVYLCEEDAVEEQRGLLLVLGDVCIAVHAKHLRVRVDGEGVDRLQVALVLQRGEGRRRRVCLAPQGEWQG